MADPNGIVARTVAALRYAVTGQAPTDWFGPGTPLPDQAPPEVQGRAFDYPNFVNINYLPRNTEPVGFKKLKLLATNCEPLKMVMARQRDLVKAAEWNIKPRQKQKSGAAPDAGAVEIQTFLQMPDRQHDWPQWVNGVLDQLFVYDAVSIYSRPTRGGDLFALELIDGSTITPLVDSGGRQPMMPDAAFKQVLKGLPAVSYTTDELIYYPENWRVDHIYGSSRVEQIIQTVEATIARLKSQLGYFEHGNVGDGYFTAPKDFPVDEIVRIEKAWNAMMSADGGTRLAQRRQVPWMPADTEWHATKVDIFQAEFDEWLIRLICFVFGVPPTPFLKQMGMGHGSAQTDKDSAEEGGTTPIKEYVRNLMNRILAFRFNRPDLEFAWVEHQELDPKAADEIADKQVKRGGLTIDEDRDRRGLEPLPDGLGAKPLIYTSTGAVLLDAVVNPPEPEPVPAPLAGANPDEEPKPGEEAPADGDKTEALKKAANLEPDPKLLATISTFLSARAAEAAPVIADALGLAKADDAMDEDYSGRIDHALDQVDWNWSPLAQAIDPLLGEIATVAGEAGARAVGLFDQNVLDRLMKTTVDYAHDRAAGLVGMSWNGSDYVPNPDPEMSISDTTRSMLRGEIEGAMERGDSNAELSKAIQESTAFSKERAATIARTETANAAVQGQIAGWKATGLVAGRQFVAAPDCCDECQAQDGVIVGIDEEFPEGDAPLHPNCRCTEEPVLPEDMPGGDADDD